MNQGVQELMDSGRLRFVVLDGNGAEVDCIDPVVEHEWDGDVHKVTTHYGPYESTVPEGGSWRYQMLDWVNVPNWMYGELK